RPEREGQVDPRGDPGHPEAAWPSLRDPARRLAAVRRLHAEDRDDQGRARFLEGLRLRAPPRDPRQLMVMGERLRVRSVTIQYATESGLFTAVEDVSFAVEAGERFVLLGPSGCGKSTLLQAVAGFIRPSRGRVE